MTGHSQASSLLLLDLDGVVVFEHGPPWVERLEIMRLHESLTQFLLAMPLPPVVVTHRSRAEASRILLAAGVQNGTLRHVMAAEDLALAAFRHRSIFRLMTRGLRKSLIIPELELRYGIERQRMALIDDRQDNLDDMLEQGLGLVIHAPSAVTDQGDIITFSTSEVTDILSRWQAGVPMPKVITLTERRLSLEDCGRTGLCTTAAGAHMFNRLRSVAQRARRALQH
jgi:hypothetical protein